MIDFLIWIFALALVLYTTLAGADFGAGMIEFFARLENREEEEEVISHALAPVWEANHVWIILALVILFSAFPVAFSELVTVFHIPLLLMLFGIILRGCAFTFRHYDPYYDGSQRLYAQTFILSSFLTPLAQGLVVGGCMLGQLSPNRVSFAAVYILPWCNLFCFSVGLFLGSLYFFLAAVFLIGETKEQRLQLRFQRRARGGAYALFSSSALVFLLAERAGLDLFTIYSAALPCFGLICSGIFFFLVWLFIRDGRFQLARFFAAAVSATIVGTWFSVSYPFIMGGHPGALTSLSLLDSPAPPATLRELIRALFVGALFIFPSLGYLFFVFKNPRRSEDASAIAPTGMNSPPEV